MNHVEGRFTGAGTVQIHWQAWRPDDVRGAVVIAHGAGETSPPGVPLLVMHGTADRLAPVDGAVMVNDRAASSDRTLRLYEGLYHEILNEPEQESVLADLVGWLEARTATAPASR